MKIKIFAILITLALAFSLIACNSASPGDMADPGAPDSPYDDKNGDSEIYPDAVIKNATVYAETKEFDSAVSDLTSLISSLGGYVHSSSVVKNPSYSGSSDYERHANYTVRIPAKNFDAFTKGLENFLNITSLSTSVSDVSEELYDLESTLETLKKKRDTLKAMLDEVDSSSQWSYYWQISNEIDSIEAQIARINAQLSELEGRIDYSTLTISISEVLVFSEAGGPTFGEQIADAFTASLTVLLEILRGILLMLIFLIPFAVVGGIIAFLIVLIVRLSSKKKKKKAAANPPAPPVQNTQTTTQSPYGNYGPYDRQ